MDDSVDFDALHDLLYRDECIFTTKLESRGSKAPLTMWVEHEDV